MVHPTTMIQIADVKNDIVKSYTISDFFQKYSHKAGIDDNMSRIINFDSSDGIKITDWTGWTEVLSIRKINNHEELWKSIKIIHQDYNDMVLNVSKNEYVPIYGRKSIRGFHGEIKYPYNILPITKIQRHSLMRAIIKSDLTDPDGMYEINISNETYMYEIINSPEIYSRKYTSGYEIVTKSGFYNGNQFHLYGACPVIPVGTCYK